MKKNLMGKFSEFIDLWPIDNIIGQIKSLG